MSMGSPKAKYTRWRRRSDGGLKMGSVRSEPKRKGMGTQLRGRSYTTCVADGIPTHGQTKHELRVLVPPPPNHTAHTSAMSSVPTLITGTMVHPCRIASCAVP